jgi:hypothetical protein
MLSGSQILKERRDRRELAPDRRAGDCPALQVLAPCDDMRAGDDTEFLGTPDASKVHEVAEIVLVRAAGMAVRDVREPDLGKQTCKIPGWTLKLARTRELSMLFAL